jgi:hypothetical protein
MVQPLFERKRIMQEFANNLAAVKDMKDRRF